MSALPIIASQRRPSVGLFIHQQGTWAGFRPSWDRLVLPYWWKVVATVIQLSTRGTVGSDNWFMGLAEQPVPRSYHLQDNDWTPLSQNLCWKATIYLLSVFTRSDRLRPNTKLNRLSGTESVKSFVDDFDMERGIVSARVGLSYDSLRLSLCSGDLLPQISRTNESLFATPQINPKQNFCTKSTKVFY